MSSLLPESDLREDFRRRRTRQLVIVVPVLLALIATGSGSAPVIAIGFALVVGAFVFTLVNWRCPACSKYLGRGINPSLCRKCGFKLKA